LGKEKTPNKDGKKNMEKEVKNKNNVKRKEINLRSEEFCLAPKEKGHAIIGGKKTRRRPGS